MQAYRSEALHTFAILNILQARLNNSINNTQVSLFTLALNDGDSNTIWHNSMGRRTSQYSLHISMVCWTFYTVNSPFYMVNSTFFMVNSTFYMVN